MSDIIVYGRGKTGQSLMNLLQKMGKTGIFYDDTDGFDCETDFSNKTVIVSPGVPPYAKGYRMAEQYAFKIIGELEFCFRLCKGKCISVTGTNGKTTTCEMIHKILKYFQMPCRLLGNGGIPFSSQVLDIGCNEYVVLESSSFQLLRCGNFEPVVSVFTNIAPDHLNWHGTYENYRCAKTNNFINQKSGIAIFNYDDKDVVELSGSCKCNKRFYSVSDPTADCYFDGKNVILIIDGLIERCNAEYMNGFLLHNRSNALAAILACSCVGVPLTESVNALENFCFLPHRLQTIGQIGGVKFVDDSKATNVHATVSALQCFSDSLALILGGSDKRESYDAIFANMTPNVRCVVAVGQTAENIKQCAAKYDIEVVVLDDIKVAVRYCYDRLISDGGVVLMSNACASFDRFHDFEERGQYFAMAVEELKIENKTN